MFWLVNSFIVGAGLVVAVAVALDTYVSSSKKDILSRLVLESKAAKFVGSAGLTEFIALFHSHVVVPVFGEKPLSVRFIATSAALTLCFLSASCIMYALLNAESFAGIVETARANWMYLAIGVAGAIAVDWVSFAQTSLFLSLMAQAKSLVGIVWIALADAILTSNIFTFVFAAFVAAMAYAVTFEQPSLDFELVYADYSKVAGQETDDGLAGLLVKDGHYVGQHMQASYRKGMLFNKATGYSVRVFSNIDGLRGEDVLNAAGARFGRPKDISLDQLLNYPTGSFELSGPLPSGLSNAPWWYYSTGFLFSNTVRDGFAGPLLDGLVTQPLSAYFIALSYSPFGKYKILGPEKVCRQELTGETGMYFTKAEPTDECEQWVWFAAGLSSYFQIKRLTDIARSIEIPIYLYFACSFALTLSVYFMMAIFVTGGLFYKAIARLVGREWIELNTHLFVTLSMPLACLAGLAATLWV